MQDSKGGVKKLLLKATSLIIISLAIISLYNVAYLKIALFERNPVFSVTKFKNVPEEIDYCNFGNSLAADAFGNYDGFDENCFNFALSAQTLSYDYRIMQQYKDRMNDGTIVFITLNYSCFAVDERNDGNFEAKNERYYNFLSPNNIKNFSLLEYGIIRTLPVLWQTPLAILQKWQTYRAESNLTASRERPDFSGTAEGFHRGRNVIDDNGKLIVKKEELDSLVDMIRTCHERGAKPILIITPYRHEYTELYDNSFYEQYYGLLDNICEVEHCVLYDMSHDEEFELTDDYFSDAYHLSEDGSMIFMRKIRSIIEENRLD